MTPVSNSAQLGNPPRHEAWHASDGDGVRRLRKLRNVLETRAGPPQLMAASLQSSGAAERGEG